MDYQFSDVINSIEPSFIREMLKLTTNKEIISFAGGLPDPQLFPYEDIKNATNSMFAKHKESLFQYSTTEGHQGLRDWIAARFSKAHDVEVSADQVMIVSGSQQALDLVGKIFINPQDTVAVESPSYLGAIQAFKMYSPKLQEVHLATDGVDIEQLQQVMANEKTKFFYGIPNFQNPTGITYSEDKRRRVADVLKASGKIMLEDDPYGGLRFPGTSDSTQSIYSLAPDNVIYMGSFSKIFVPGFRLGWVIAPTKIITNLVIAKQAADLHTNSFVQAILYEYVKTHNLDEHIDLIKTDYAKKKQYMVEAINTHMGDAVDIYPTNGGMFIWMKVHGVIASDLMPYAIKQNVVFVPGEAFSLSKGYQDHMRLNFTNLDYAQIDQGVINLKQALLAYRQDNPLEAAS